MSLGLSCLLTGHLLSMTVAMGTGAMPIWKENWEQCSLRQKLHRGGREGECLLLVLTLSCLFYPPPTHFHQTISLSNAEVKVCISYRSSWNREGLCEMNTIALRAGALLAGSICHFGTQQHWALSVFPSSHPWPNALQSSLGHGGDTKVVSGGAAGEM